MKNTILLVLFLLCGEAFAQTTIYSHSSTVFCDGIYDGAKGASYENYFYDHMRGLDKRNFEISFDFKPHRDNTKSWPLMLGRSGRIFGIVVTTSGKLGISINNQEEYYWSDTSINQNKSRNIQIDDNDDDSGSKHDPNRVTEWNNIKVKHQRGTVYMYLNGNHIATWYIKKLDWKYWHGNITSWNYSNGIAYYGYLKNIKIKNI